MQFIDLEAQLESIRPAIDKRISAVLDHGQYIMGPEVAELESNLAKFVGVKHCISCANGTDALQIALMALGIKPGDIVFTTAFTFFATAEVIPQLGAQPFFVDIDPHTYNICPNSLEAAICHAQTTHPGKGKAVIAVDLFGLPANYPVLQTLCEKYNLKLIEDAAQGFGGAIGERKNGSFGDIATTSFFPAKPLGCFGDGGAIFTNDDELALLSKSIRVHGKGEHKYENVRIGLNSRLDTIQAAVLLEKMQIFGEELKAKQQVADYYSEQLRNAVNTPQIPTNYTSAWAQYTVFIPNQKRPDCQQAFKKAGIPCAVYYPKGLNRQIAFDNCLALETTYSDRACESVLSLPMHAYLTEQHLAKISEVLLSTVAS